MPLSARFVTGRGIPVRLDKGIDHPGILPNRVLFSTTVRSKNTGTKVSVRYVMTKIFAKYPHVTIEKRPAP